MRRSYKVNYASYYIKTIGATFTTVSKRVRKTSYQFGRNYYEPTTNQKRLKGEEKFLFLSDSAVLQTGNNILMRFSKACMYMPRRYAE